MHGIWVQIPGQGTKIPHAAEQLNPQAANTEPVLSGASGTAKIQCSQVDKC